MNLKNRVKFCFFDDFWLKGKSSTVRRWFEPQYFSSYCDDAFGGMHDSSLVFDEETGKYRLYYCGFDPEDEKNCYIALSESDDLLNFEPVSIKQRTDRYPGHVIDVTKEGKAADEFGSTGVVIYDRFETDPARRYKLMCYMMSAPSKQARDLHVAFSADGLHWKLQPDMIALSTNSDTLNKLYYSPYTEEYSLIHRAALIDRRIAKKETKDFKNWSDPRVVLHPGPRYNSDDSMTELYGMTAAWHDGIFLGITWPYHMKFYETLNSPMNGYIESELVYSYDGEHFMDTTTRPLVKRHQF